MDYFLCFKLLFYFFVLFSKTVKPNGIKADFCERDVVPDEGFAHYLVPRGPNYCWTRVILLCVSLPGPNRSCIFENDARNKTVLCPGGLITPREAR